MEAKMNNLMQINFLYTPHMGWLSFHEWWSEEKNPKDIAKFWDNTNYTLGQKLRRVVGRDFAWCGAAASTALIESGFASPRSARASDYMTYGIDLGVDLDNLIFGSLVVIQHKDGSYHVTFFYGWQDQKNRLAILFGGNQSNAIRKSIYDLNVDRLAANRWPVKG